MCVHYTIHDGRFGKFEINKLANTVSHVVGGKMIKKKPLLQSNKLYSLLHFFEKFFFKFIIGRTTPRQKPFKVETTGEKIFFIKYKEY